MRMIPQEINWHVWFNTGSKRIAYILRCNLLFTGIKHLFILRIEIRKVAKILRTDSLEDENSIVTSVLLSRHSLLPRGRLFSWFHGLKHGAWCLYSQTKNAIFLQGWSVFQVCTYTYEIFDLFWYFRWFFLLISAARNTRNFKIMIILCMEMLRVTP